MNAELLMVVLASVGIEVSVFGYYVYLRTSARLVRSSGPPRQTLLE